jgi:hypothetical protein
MTAWFDRWLEPQERSRGEEAPAPAAVADWR